MPAETPAKAAKFARPRSEGGANHDTPVSLAAGSGGPLTEGPDRGSARPSLFCITLAPTGAKKADVEEVLDSLAALGIICHLAAYDARGTRRWKSTRSAA